MEFNNQVIHGDCLEVLRQIPDNTFDSCVTDPPYGLGSREPTIEELIAYLQGAELDSGGDFMGKDWKVPSVTLWLEVFRVLKPGAHVLAFGGTRTFDLISLGLRAAGFEYRDTFQWIYGQGFPKSLNVSKALDKKAGAEREVIGTYRVSGNALTPTSVKGGTYVTGAPNSPAGDLEVTAPATDEAKAWDGWGTALKPSWEPILMFRKPLEGTVVESVLEHGTGAINIDGCRVGNTTRTNSSSPRKERTTMVKGMTTGTVTQEFNHGRWPPNVLLSHSEGCKRVGTKKVKGANYTGADPKEYGIDREVYSAIGDRSPSTYVDEDGTETIEAWDCVEGCPVRVLDEQTGDRPSTLTGRADPNTQHENPGDNGGASWFGGGNSQVYADSGGASRFFPTFKYEGKATKKEATLDGEIENKHPTKKPLKLMQWLVRLVTQKDGLVLDPYCGSGTTLHAAVEEGLRFTGIDAWDYAYEVSSNRMTIVCQRAQEEQGQRDLFELAMELEDGDSL